MKVCSKCSRNYDDSEYNNLSVCLDDGADLIMVLVLSPETIENMKTPKGEGYWTPPENDKSVVKSLLFWVGLSIFLLLMFFGLVIFLIFQISK